MWKKDKVIVPMVIGLFMVLYLIYALRAMILNLGDLILGNIVLLSICVVFIVIIICVIITVIQRIKELKGEDEDDLSKY